MQGDARLHESLEHHARCNPEASCLIHADCSANYARVATWVSQVSNNLLAHGLDAADRVAVVVAKRPETVAALLGTARAGGVFVPINPVLKPAQVQHIVVHSEAKFLMVGAAQLAALLPCLADCPHLEGIFVHAQEADADAVDALTATVPIWTWQLDDHPTETAFAIHERASTDMVAIIYTSGSTGKPKGIMLSHRNMVIGARSVSDYLKNTAEDRLLALMPLSFDYGLSQITTAFHVGASVVLMDYFLPRDVVLAVARHGITGVPAVPHIWNRLARLDWPPAARDNLRYITNTGGAMPVVITRELARRLPTTAIYLMFGLTEAFRSTYLDPGLATTRPDSIGKAIPHATISVIDEHGQPCAPDQPGELVHSGPLVALGYWKDPVKTAVRFKPSPVNEPEPGAAAAWSGDEVRQDEQGYLYFIGREDDLIKTHGFRVSPNEVEELIYDHPCVTEAIVLGVPDPDIGQGIVALVATSAPCEIKALTAHCRSCMPNHMVPGRIVCIDEFPRNPNGKIDRKSLHARFADSFIKPSDNRPDTGRTQP